MWPEGSGIPPGGVPPTLVMCGDQASDQTCPFSFLKYARALNFEQCPDRSHLSNNASLNAAVHAGFHGIIRVSVTIYNLRYGPRNHGRFFELLQASASDIATNISAKDPLVRHLWGAICEDRGWSGEDDAGQAACASFLRTLPASKAATVKGPQCGTSRWYSYIHCHWYWDAEWNTTVLLGVFTALCSGWAKVWQDIFRVDQGQARAAVQAILDADAADHSRGEDPLADASNAASSSSGQQASSSSRPPRAPAQAPPGDDGGTPSVSAVPLAGQSKRSQESCSKTVYKAASEGTANSMHAIIRLMSRDDIRSQCRMLGICATPFARENGA